MFNRHYIRAEGGLVTKGFSDAFETPLQSDICINKQGGRHFEINGVTNPPLVNEEELHIYRYDKKMRRATEEELFAEKWKFNVDGV